MDYYNLDRECTFLITQRALIREGESLLVLENKSGESGGTSEWEIPGGLLELDESLSDGLRREVREETNLDVSIGAIVAIWDHWVHGFKFRDGRVLDVRFVEIAFLSQRTGGEIRLSQEHRQHRWATRDELRCLTFAPNSQFAVEKYLSGQAP